MPTFLIVILCIVGLVIGVGGFPLLLAAADPEGRGGNIVLAGIACTLGGAAMFIVFGVFALVRWLH